MSKRVNIRFARLRHAKFRDEGMTLPEVLISVVLTALLVTALSMSITVVLRQSDNTTGRLNNSRSEQSVSLWMPADLASAESVSTDAAALPCDLPCPPSANIGGSNALMLTWTSQSFDTATGNPVITTTKVSYRYMQMGDEWVMVRVECSVTGTSAATCQSATVLHGLDAPPGDFIPGQSVPSWVIKVSQALDPASTGAPDETIPADPTLKNKNGQRVVVTINGGGDVAGAGGGTNQISLSAGGTERTDLPPQDPSGVPPFVAARSRCGGNFALVVDLSSSITTDQMGSKTGVTTNWATVRGSIYKFIEAFQGTPVKLEIVTFSTQGATLGTTGDNQMYFDMLDPTQVTTLKSLVGYPNTSGGLQANGDTNWEDAFYQVFNKSDGTVQPILPKTLIFFTDGVPTKSRVQTDAQTMLPEDQPLPAPQTAIYYQVGWNRANRLMRQYDGDVQTLIGMYVGSSAADDTWVDTQGFHTGNWQRGYHSVLERANNNMAYEKGYHNDYQRNNNVVWERGYNDLYQRNNNVVWERGYHNDFQRNNNVVYERGYNETYQRNNNVVWQRGYHLQGSTKKYSSPYSSWESTNQTTYASSNTTADSSDGWRTVVSGGLSGTWATVTAAEYNASNTTTDNTDGWNYIKSYTSPYNSWESTTSAAYDAANTTTDATDGWRTRVNGSLSTSWTSVTQAQYNASNTTADSTDGWQIATTKSYTAPYSSWETTSQTTYGSSNTTTDATDGWRTRVNGSLSGSWTTVTAAEYNASNTTTDNTDGWNYVKTYAAPFNSWESTPQATYASSNTTADATDGWRTRVNGSLSGSWTSVPAGDYNASNTTSDNTDGWQIAKSYSSPFDQWEASTWTAYSAGSGGNTAAGEGDGWRTRVTGAITSWTTSGVTQAMYDNSNTTADATDGWRLTKTYSSPYSAWEATTEALFNANNTNATPDSSDGWTADKVYAEPFTGYEAKPGVTVLDKDILGRFVQPVGNPVTPVTDASGNVTNAATANLYSLANYGLLNNAMQAIALNECGGTLTIQTRLDTTGASVVDPFTYQNSINQQVVTTTQQFRGGTYDFSTTGTVTPKITLQNTTEVSHYIPATPVNAGWACTAKGQPRAFTTTPIPGTPFSSITVSVSANEAVSCTQTVHWQG